MRTEFIAQALDINIVQAEIFSEMIKDIPDNKLKDFFVFRMKYIEPMMSKELVTKKALFDYRRMQFEQNIKLGSYSFDSKEQLQNYLQTYYKGKEVGNGLGPFYDYVVIGIDQEGNFINKYVVDDFTGKYKKLNSEDVDLILEDLLQNQTKVGDVKHIPYYETAYKLDHGPTPLLDGPICDRTRQIIGEK